MPQIFKFSPTFLVDSHVVFVHKKKKFSESHWTLNIDLCLASKFLWRPLWPSPWNSRGQPEASARTSSPWNASRTLHLLVADSATSTLYSVHWRSCFQVQQVYVTYYVLLYSILLLSSGAFTVRLLRKHRDPQKMQERQRCSTASAWPGPRCALLWSATWPAASPHWLTTMWDLSPFVPRNEG